MSFAISAGGYSHGPAVDLKRGGARSVDGERSGAGFFDRDVGRLKIGYGECAAGGNREMCVF